MDETKEKIIGTREVQMIEESAVEQVRALGRLGWGARRIAREVGVARNTVRKYLDESVQVGVQERLEARSLQPQEVERARDLYKTTADGNAVVVRDLLAEEGVQVPVRTLQRYLAPLRREQLVRDAATVRFESKPGEQLQVDFGERKVSIGDVLLTVYFFVATLGFSRRTYVRASLSQRQDEWKLGLEGALQRFGGRPQRVVVDNAKALIVEHSAERTVVHPAFRAYCEDRELAVFACRPYRARTKGKVESGVKYVKRNAIAKREFASFALLEGHLEAWMVQADERIHGTTHRRPIDLFREAEVSQLRPLHDPRLVVAAQRLRRKVANDCFIDLDTVRYSVPHQLVRSTVEVTATPEEVVVFAGGREVARHRRGRPFERVLDPRHFAGLHRQPVSIDAPAGTEKCDPLAVVTPLAEFGRSLADYERLVGGAP